MQKGAKKIKQCARGELFCIPRGGQKVIFGWVAMGFGFPTDIHIDPGK
jgi:hypothetical protein